MGKHFIFHLFFLLLIPLFYASCKSNENKEPKADNNETLIQDSTQKFAELTFIDDFYDFGSIKQGEVVSITFRFKNTGNIPLVIKDIIAECGCTKSKTSKQVINPGEVASVEVIFDSSGWRGLQYKSVTIRSNGKIKDKSVTIKANVVS